MHGTAYVAEIESALAQRGWHRLGTTPAWQFMASTPPGGTAPDVPRTCVCRPTEIDPTAGAVYPPGVFYRPLPGFSDRPPAADTEDFWPAAKVCGMDDAHLLRSGVMESLGLPGDAEDVIALLERIESWRWPTALPLRGFGGEDFWQVPLPSDLPVLMDAVCLRKGWTILEYPHEGQSLHQIWPAFTCRDFRVMIVPCTVRGGYLVCVRGDDRPRLRADTAAEVVKQLSDIELW